MVEKITVRELKRRVADAVVSNPELENVDYGGVFNYLSFCMRQAGRGWCVWVQDFTDTSGAPTKVWVLCGDDGEVMRIGSFDKVCRVALDIVGVKPASSAKDELRNVLFISVLGDDAELMWRGPPVTAAQKSAAVAKMQKTMVRQAALIEGIDGQLSMMDGWERVNGAHAAKKAGLMERRALIVQSGVNLAREIAELQA